MSNLDCVKPKPCPPVEPEKEVYPPATEPFSFCAGNYTISWDGARLRHEKTRDIPDGEYGAVHLSDGCIIDVGPDEIPTYSPPYCSPNPTPCGDGSGDGSYSVSISSQAGNTLTQTPLGLYAKTYVKAGSNVSVTGSGTSSSPYVINAASGSGNGNLISNTPHITLTNTGGATAIDLAPSGIEAGTYGSLEVNQYGIITGYAGEAPEDAIIDVVGTGDINASTANGIVTISHNPSQVGNRAIDLGGYSVRLDSSGHVTNATRRFTVEGGSYALGGFIVDISNDGIITSIEEDTGPVEDSDVLGPIIDIINFSFSELGTVAHIESSSNVEVIDNGGRSYILPQARRASDVTVLPKALDSAIGVRVSDTDSGVVATIRSVGDITSGKFIIRG